jgi:hypothetical protein
MTGHRGSKYQHRKRQQGAPGSSKPIEEIEKEPAP